MAFLGKLIKQKCDNSEYLCNTLCPVLVIHGIKVGQVKEDELIPYADIVEMYHHLKNPKISLVITDELEHNVYDEYKDLFQPIKDFYSTVYPLDRVIDYSIAHGRSTHRFSRVSRLSLL